MASTLILYLDKEFLRLVREQPGRYIYLPIAFILASGTIFTFASPASQLGAYVLFWGWQTYHYGRQNVGVYSFASIARGWRPHPLERRTLQLTVACAICGTFKITSQFLDRDAAPGVLHAIFVVSTTPAAPALLDFLAGISLGLTVSHFVIDAGAWRLSRPSVRQYVTRRFAFLFEPAAR